MSEVKAQNPEGNHTEHAVDGQVQHVVRLGQAQDPEGMVWEVVVCASGETENGWYLPDDVLRMSAALFENVDVNLYELPGSAGHLLEPLFTVKDLLVKNKAGWLDSVRFVAGQGLTGLVHLVDSYRWLGKNLLNAMRMGTSLYGLSWDALATGTRQTRNGKDINVLRKFAAVDSLDIVSRPAAGGKFIRAVAAHDQGRGIMDRDQLLALIKEKRPGLLEGKDEASIADADLGQIARMAMEKDEQPKKDTEQRAQDGQAISRQEFELFRCGQVLETTLAGSGLPEHGLKPIRGIFAGRVSCSPQARG